MKNRTNTLTTAARMIAILCCICAVVAGTGYAYRALRQFLPIPTMPAPFPSNPPPTLQPHSASLPPFDAETLEILRNTIVPSNNPRDLACRLKALCNVPEVMAASAAPRHVGDTDSFWVHDLDANKNKRVQATLRYVTPHLYFWVQDGVQVNENEVKALADEFENNIYPTTREFFGREWSPGIDGDEHIYILYARGLGSSIAGYFSSADSIHPLIHEYSNGHEMFLFNADNTPLSSRYTYSVLAHEFQHMIHWNQDANETSWLNEGASELSAFINGYNTGGFDWLYLQNTDLQLNDWPNDQNATAPHYGASFLFMTYFLDRFGEEATKLLVQNPLNGLESVDDVLRQIGAADPVTGKPITADDFFADWAVTNFVLDGSIGDGRYIYNNYPNARRASVTETFSTCPQSDISRTVRQYGVDYIAIECSGEYTLSFRGSQMVKLLPADPYSAQYAFWSNKGNESNMRLTRQFDFTGVSAPIELSFWTWYDIETDWDYLYVAASEDGKTWEILLTPSGTGTNPSGNSYGWGYTGATGGWIQEKVDLSRYAGKKVFVRFEYVTDAAVNGEGFLLDDVEVTAINYRSDFEADDGGWGAEGFARIRNVLPQRFQLALILTRDSSVTMIPLNEDQTAEIPLAMKEGEKAFLAISGITRFTREPASYRIEIR